MNPDGEGWTPAAELPEPFVAVVLWGAGGRVSGCFLSYDRRWRYADGHDTLGFAPTHWRKDDRVKPFPKPPAGMMIVGYRPKPGLPLDADGHLLLDFEFAPIKRALPPQIEPQKLSRGVPKPAQGSLL